MAVYLCGGPKYNLPLSREYFTRTKNNIAESNIENKTYKRILPIISGIWVREASWETAGQNMQSQSNEKNKKWMSLGRRIVTRDVILWYH